MYKFNGVNLILNEKVPVRNGFTFKGWAKTKKAAASEYDAGGIYSTNANVTLYAVWTTNTYVKAPGTWEHLHNNAGCHQY